MTDTTYTPRFPVPKGACDCHYHIFGPATRFPPNPEIQHLMPDALAADNAKMWQDKIKMDEDLILAGM